MQRHLIPFVTSFYAARVETVVHLMDMTVSDQASFNLSEPLTMCNNSDVEKDRIRASGEKRDGSKGRKKKTEGEKRERDRERNGEYSSLHLALGSLDKGLVVTNVVHHYNEDICPTNSILSYPSSN